MYVRVAESVQTRLPNNVWTQTKILCPNNVIYATLSQVTCFFEGFGAKYGKKQCFMVKKCTITWYILEIQGVQGNEFAKFAITRQNDAFVAN